MSFDEIIIYLTTKQAVMIYMIIAFSAFIENLFPPYPSDMVILAGTYLAGQGDIAYIPLFISAVIGGLAGAMVLYSFGFVKGRSIFVRYNRSYLKLENLEKIERWFRRWGNYALIFSRFVAGVRSIVAITAGIGKVPVSRMVSFSLVGFCLWYLILMGGMFLVKSNWQELTRIIKSYNVILVIVSAVALTIWLIIIYFRNRKKA